MAGPRFIDWSHIRVEGDRDAAAPYVNEARKLMGYVQEEAARQGLGVHNMRREMSDGTVLIAEKHGEIPRMTIVPVPAGRERRGRVTFGFHITWAGNAANRTPILYNAPSGEPGSDDHRDWSASFFNSDAYGYNLVPEDRRSASYIDVFGAEAGTPGVRLLPANGIWYHPDDEEVVSWFRGYNGYWPHHYRHPITNYADYVSIFGHIAYVIPDLAWRVLAAAMKDGWLYVMIAEDLGALAPDPPSGQPSYSGQVWCSQPYDATPRTYSLWRYPLLVETQQATGIETYRAAPHDDAEKLWSGALELAYGAWSFNRDCSRCVTVQLPRIAVWSPVYTVVGNDWVPSSDESSSFPQVEVERIELAIELDPEPLATLSSTPAPALVAESDDVQLTIEEAERTSSYGRVVYRCGDFEIPVVEYTSTGSVRWYDRRVMIHADLPTRTFLFYRWRTDILPARHVEAGYELYVDGETVELANSAPIDESYSAGSYDAAIAANYLLQMSTAYDDGVTSWLRPMDAMTFLLGFTFVTQGALPATGGSFAPNFGYQTCPHIAFSFADTNYIEHTAAGGYVFGSVRGTPGSLFWGDFPFAATYGANRGSFADPAPMEAPVISHLGGAATFGEDTLAVVGLQPLLAVNIGGASGGLFLLANANRVTRAGTRGDAAPVLDPLYPPGLWSGGVIGHTGKARKHQRGNVQWQ